MRMRRRKGRRCRRGWLVGWSLLRCLLFVTHTCVPYVVQLGIQVMIPQAPAEVFRHHRPPLPVLGPTRIR